MKEWVRDFSDFWKNKYYVCLLSLSAVLGFGYLITHQTVGIDDTPYALYFEEGLSVIVGRWVLFLVNKVFRIAEFAPFVTDLAGVLILMAAVTVWCVLMRRILGDRVPMAGYIFYACLFLSNPLHAEVFTYYLHNGTAIGYLFSGIGLCCFWEGLCRAEDQGKENKGSKGRSDKERRAWWKPWALCTLCLWIALGCYESFMVVFLSGVCVILCTAAMTRRDGKGPKLLVALGAAAVIAVAGMALRSLSISVFTALFGLEGLSGEAVQRSVWEMAGWIGNPENAGLFGMLVKRIFVMYGVFAYAYYPIKIYVFSCLVIGFWSVFMGIRRKNFRIPLLAVMSFVASYLLVFVEGKATLYRSAQFLPMVSAWGMFLLAYAARSAGVFLKKLRSKCLRPLGGIVSAAALAVMTAVLWNQCTDLNHWFYIDEIKYEHAKNVASQVMFALRKNFDYTKPVAFTGSFQVPESIIQDAYVPYGSPVFFKMKRITDLIDPHLLEKYYRDYGVWTAQTPELSVINWGKNAFGNSAELARFFSMHGYDIRGLEDTELYGEAYRRAIGMPSFPNEGSIVDVGDYIIVNF